MSELEESLAWAMLDENVPAFEREYKFHPIRRWRFDFAWPEHKVAVEVQGGTWSGGAHVRGVGYEADCHKLNEAQIMGWLVLYVTGKQVASGKAMRWLRRALAARGWDGG